MAKKKKNQNDKKPRQEQLSVISTSPPHLFMSRSGVTVRVCEVWSDLSFCSAVLMGLMVGLTGLFLSQISSSSAIRSSAHCAVRRASASWSQQSSIVSFRERTAWERGEWMCQKHIDNKITAIMFVGGCQYIVMCSSCSISSCLNHLRFCGKHTIPKRPAYNVY